MGEPFFWRDSAWRGNVMDEDDLKALPDLIALFHQLGDMSYRHEAITLERGVEILNTIQRYHGLLEYACVVCRDTEPKF